MSGARDGMSSASAPRRRTVITFLAALFVLGAASAVGGAWFGASVTSVGWDRKLIEWSNDGRPAMHIDDAWTVTSADSWCARGWRIVLDRPGAHRPNAPAAPLPPSWSRVWQPWSAREIGRCWFEAEFGWPLTFMCVRAQNPDDARPIDRAELVEMGLAIEPVEWDLADPFGIPRFSVRDYLLERRVARDASVLAALPLGFRLGRAVLSTLAWSMIWLAIFGVVRLCLGAKDARRRRRGLCVACRHLIVPSNARVDPLSPPKPVRCAECGHFAGDRRPFATRSITVGALLLAALVLLAEGAWAIHREGKLEKAPALHRAALRGDVVAIERELAAGAPVDDPSRRDWNGDPDGATALMLAAGAGHFGAVRALLESGADPAMRGWRTAPPANWAAFAGHVEIVDLLIAAINERRLRLGVPPDVESDGDEADLLMTAAISGGASDMIDHVLAMTRDRCAAKLVASPSGLRLLAAAAASGDSTLLPRVVAALESSASASPALRRRLIEECNALLVVAAAGGSIENVRWLLRTRGAHATSNCALYYASVEGRRAVIVELLEAGANCNCGQDSPLTHVIRRGMTDLVERLLAAGAELNGRPVGDHPILACFEVDDLAIARMLIKAGSRVSVNRMAWGILIRAVDWDRTSDDWIRLIINQPESIDLPDQNGHTMLMLAVEQGSEKWVRVLLDRGADPRAADESGKHVIEFATEPGVGALITQALERGANR